MKMFLTDVDGTLTDGCYYSPSIQEIDIKSAEGRHVTHGLMMPPEFYLRKFNTSDFVGIKMLHDAGIKCAALTGSYQSSMPQFDRAAPFMQVFAGVQDKFEFIKTTFVDTGRYSWGDIGFIGDEINDCRLLQAVGWPACPADAVDQVRAIVAANDDGYISESNGGEKCVREFTDWIRRALDIKASWCNWEEE